MEDRNVNVSGKTIVVEKQSTSGLSAYQIALKNRFVGTELEWLNSLRSTSSSTPSVKNNFYTHTQSVAASIWTIPHNLGFFPNVTVTDSSGRKVLTDVIYLDINTVQVIVENAFSGTAYLS